MIGAFLKKKFGKSEPEIKEFCSLRVRNSGSIAIDTSVFLLHDEYLTMVSPGEDPLRVTDVGITNVLGTKVYRFYLRAVSGDEYWLQVIEDMEGIVTEATLFSQVDEIYPQSGEDWDKVIHTLNNDKFSLDQDSGNLLSYEPIWQRLVEHEEKVYPSKEGEEPYSYALSSMLFSRDCSEDQDGSLVEKLLVAIEEEERVSVYVGIDVSPAGLTII